MIKNILNSETKSINLAAFILGAANLISAALGLLRDLFLARQFGASNELDIYYAAFKIPDFVALILIMGAISAAVVPIFSQYLLKSKEEAWDFLSNFVNVCLFVLILVSVVMVIFAPLLMSLVAPGFGGEKRELAIFLTRIMFLSPIILGVSNVMSGILQVFNRFLITSLAPILYNVGIIFGILFFAPRIGVAGLAWGVVFGALLHLIIQLPTFLQAGFKYKTTFNFSHKGVLRVFKLMVPRSLGLAASQINLIIVTAIASTLAAGSIAIFTLANNVIAIIITMIALPFSTSVFPALSLSFLEENKTNFFKQFSSALRHVLFLVVPLSFLFFALRTQIITILFRSFKFSISDVYLAATCLGLFSLGVFAQGLTLLISKTFFAAHNTKIPALVSGIVVIVNVALSLLFVNMLKLPNAFHQFIEKTFSLSSVPGIEVVGLPLAVSLSAIFQLFLLIFLLRKNIGNFHVKDVLHSFVKILIASLVSFALVSFVVAQSPLWLGLNVATFLGVFWQIIISAGIGAMAYVACAFLLGLTELKTIFK